MLASQGHCASSSICPFLALAVIICLWVLLVCFIVSFGDRVRVRVSFWAAFVQYLWSDSPKD